MTLSQVMYVAAGLALPLYYVPQIRRCLRDRSGLASYSMGKSGTQLILRLLMLPFVYQVGDTTMTVIVSLDTAGRIAEFCGAVVGLRRQGAPWAEIRQRSFPAFHRPAERAAHSGWEAPLTLLPEAEETDRTA